MGLAERLPWQRRAGLRRRARPGSWASASVLGSARCSIAVSLGTAKWHVGNVRATLGATNRTQALVRAQELGLV